MFDQSQIDGLNRVLGDWAVVKRSCLNTESIVIGDTGTKKSLIVFQQNDPVSERPFWVVHESDLPPEALANAPSLPLGLKEHRFCYWFDLKMFVQDFFN